MFVKRECFRAVKSVHIQVLFAIIIAWGSLFTFFVGNGNKIGISVFGELTTYKNLSEVLLNGLNFTKGLGFLITLAIALGIAQEYRYRTWVHFIGSGMDRCAIYLGKYFFSMGLAIAFFLTYTMSAYLTSVGMGKTMSFDQILFVIERGIIVYATLAGIVVFLSMSSKNHVSGILFPLAFVFCEKDMFVMMQTLLEKAKIHTRLLERYTLLQINTVAPCEGTHVFSEMLLPCVAITTVVTLLGYLLFSKYEL